MAVGLVDFAFFLGILYILSDGVCSARRSIVLGRMEVFLFYHWGKIESFIHLYRGHHACSSVKYQRLMMI